MADTTAISLGDLARVGKGTPGGEWLRRYWLVVGVARELQELPQPVRILGEDLVLFRDGRGRPGLLGLHCPHRDTSLAYGDIEDAGLRCVYHGWLFDITGQCLEQPAEPPDSTFCQRVRHLAYPVREQGGLLFAYLGPEAEPPPLPRYAPLQDDGAQRQVEAVRHQDFNWFNFYENLADPAHIWHLHRFSGFGRQTWGQRFFAHDDPPAWDLVDTPWGLKIEMHKPGPRPGTEYVNTFAIGLPTLGQIGDTEFVHLRLEEAEVASGQNAHWMFLTPNDDDHHMLFTVDSYRGPDPDFFAKLKERRAQQLAEQDRAVTGRPQALQRGVVRVEDVAAQGTQRILGERHERLGASDRGVIRVRQLVREAIAAALAGQRPRGVLAPDQADTIVDLDSFVGIRAANRGRGGIPEQPLSV